ncbi:hypothetical protein H5410_021182 [Solanum commersonii]|uniref:Uncharacterized protein n=1 Tax=Solanum commersonii TaxID=4109 RepID=A0A9J5ZBX4_SOLCO|nr:hypothetical protein H5410_021182 [Solanum commersonii]
MGSAIAVNKAHTERSRKRKREGLKPEQPASTPLSIENSEIESEEAVKYVAKRRRKAEEEGIKTKVNQKGGKKSPTKSVKVNKQKSRAKGEKGRKQLEEQTVKEPGPKFSMGNLVDAVTTQGWNHLFVPPVPYLHEPEVREFFYKMELLEGGGITTTVRNVEIHLDEKSRNYSWSACNGSSNY